MNVEVKHADGEKCPRCWIWTTDSRKADKLCRKCEQVLVETGWTLKDDELIQGRKRNRLTSWLILTFSEIMYRLGRRTKNIP